MDGHPSRIGKYDIEGMIGEGGMGVVYKGRDPLIDRVVAIKTIRTDDESDKEELLKRLRMEARSAGKLQHPNVVVVHDFGEQDDLTYLVMEYVEGRNMARIIKSGRQLPFSTKIDILVQLCQGLDYAHGLGVTHRDIKPGNIAVTSRGTAKILDFGLARVDSTRLTKTGFTSGTIAYMSPERMRGNAGASDDIFAMGAVAYELLTYQRAFPGTTYSDVVTKVLSDQYPKPPSSVANLPPDLDPIILKAMARDVVNRYQSAGEFAKALEGFRQTLAYQNFVSRSDQGDADVLEEDAPVSSTANPYSAGAMTPEPSGDLDFDTRRVSEQQGVDADDQTMQTRVSKRDQPAHEGPDRTTVRPARSTSEQVEGQPETERAIPTEIIRRVQIGPEDDLDSQPTTVGESPVLDSGARPSGGGETPDKTVQRPALDPASSDTAEGSQIRTAVMRAFRKVTGREPDPEANQQTVIDEKPDLRPPPPSPPSLRSPESGGPATGRTAPYAPGAKAPATEAPITTEPPAAAGKIRTPVAGTARGGIGIWLSGGVLLLCVLGASALAHLGGIPVYLAVYLAAVLAWIWFLRRAERLTLKHVLVIGLLLRVGLVFIPPVVAAESLRGLWDGRMVANGLNPYVLAPLADEIQMERPLWFGDMESPQDPSTTPPWALFMFMIVAWIGGGLVFWKVILLVIDLLTIRLLSREKSGHAMVLYATCPLIVLEGIWNGRIEVIVICFLVAASWAARNRSDFQGGLMAGLGVGTSFLALPALPALWGTAEKMMRMIAVTLVAAIVPLAIFATGGRMAARLRDLLFGPELSGLGLVWLTDRIERARLAESIARNGEQIVWQPLANALGRVTPSGLAAVLVAALFLVVLIIITKRSSGPDAAVANCLGFFFLVAALFSPAGWILLVPFAIAARQPLWIMYALITPLTYLLPSEGTSWMLLATMYALPPIAWLIFREDDGRVHMFDSAAGEPVPEPPAPVRA